MTAMLGAGIILPGAPSLFKGNTLDQLRYAWRSMEAREIFHARPAKNPGIITRREGGFEILSDTNTNIDVAKLNEMAAGIWRLCDGNNNAGDIVRMISDKFDVDPHSCMKDVTITLLAFKRKGLVIV